MKRLKSVGNTGSSAKNNRVNKALKILRNSKGVTLVELMATAAIGAIVSMGIASVFIFAMQQFTVLVEKNAAEENALQITYYLRQYLSQAVDVNAVTAVGSSVAGGTGQIDVNFRLLDTAFSGIGAPDTGQFARFAIFNREAGSYNVASNAIPTAGSDMRPTGIFIRDTNTNQNTFPDASSGAVVFDFNTDSGVLIPQPNDLFFSRIHDFQVQRVNCSGAGGYAAEVVREDTGQILTCLPAGWTPGANEWKIKTITLVVHTRYFKTATKGDWNYRAPVGGGAFGPYRDIVQTVKINFKNNTLTENSLVGGAGEEERVHGSLYFYDYMLPATQW